MAVDEGAGSVEEGDLGFLDFAAEGAVEELGDDEGGAEEGRDAGDDQREGKLEADAAAGE
jgi:hypothetical protein